MSAKKELRQKLQDILSDISPEERNTDSLRACQRLFAQREYVRAEVVMVFLSVSSEIDTAAIVLRAWQDHKRVLAPKVSWEQRRMMPVEIRSLTDDLRVSSSGLREPASGIPFPVSFIDLVIVPGLGFDKIGNRVGRGRGFYDRFLAHPEFQGVACGLAFSRQLIDSIPVAPLDCRVNMLVTEAAIRRFKK